MTLRITPYNPTDYSLSHPVVSDDETTIETINQVLSLYFQFAEECECFLMLNGKKHNIKLAYDEDEASPTELFVTADASLFTEIPIDQKLYVYLEVFETLFSFSVDILAQHPDDNLMVTQAPDDIRRVSRRKYPRVKMNDELRAIFGVSFNGISDFLVTATGVNSIELTTKSNLPADGIVSVDKTQIKYKIIRKEQDLYVLGLDFETGKDFGAYFDLYRKVAFPTLRSRYQFPYETGLKLFQETGYIGKYNSGDNDALLKTMHETFDPVRDEIHEFVTDYYTVNAEDLLTGSSGLAFSQINKDGVPYWCLQHMCALKNAKDIENSGVLYAWRAEYLAGRPEDLFLDVKFSSDSKWIQRIFHKFCTMRGEKSGCKLLQTRTVWVKFDPVKNETPPKISTRTIGGQKRYMAASESILVGTDPKQLNFASLLEECIVLDNTDENSLRKFVGSFLDATGNSTREIKLVHPVDSPLQQSISGEASPSNGLCIIPKDALFDFTKSIWHSIAVTKRKLGDAA